MRISDSAAAKHCKQVAHASGGKRTRIPQPHERTARLKNPSTANDHAYSWRKANELPTTAKNAATRFISAFFCGCGHYQDGNSSLKAVRQRVSAGREIAVTARYAHNRKNLQTPTRAVQVFTVVGNIRPRRPTRGTPRSQTRRASPWRKALR